MWGSHCVYILFCAIKLCASPYPGRDQKHTHIQCPNSALPAVWMCAHRVCARVWGQIRWTERKPDVNFRNGAARWGRASQAVSQLEQQADNALFSKHSGGRASGSGYLKHLAPFISPPWKWIRFLSARANEVIWLPRALCVSAAGVRLAESRRVHLSCSFLQLKLISHRMWHLGFTNFFLWKEVKIIEKVKDHLALEGMLSKTTPLMKFHRVTA